MNLPAIVIDQSGTVLDDEPVAEGRASAGHVRDGWLHAYLGSPNTLGAYRRDLKQWFEVCDRFGVDPLDATRQHVTAWVALLRNDGASAATVSRKVSAISSFYKYASSLDYIVKSPVPEDRRVLNLATVNRGESATVGPDVEQGKELVAAAAARCPRDHAIVVVLLSTGMRVSELTALRLSDMGTTSGMRYLRLTRKGGKKQRVRVVSAAAAVIDEYLEQRWETTGETAPVLASQVASRGDLPLFAGPADHLHMSRDSVAYIIRSCSRKAWPQSSAAGAQAPRFSPHPLRHSALTTMIVKGANIRDVQKVAGHTDPSTTQRYVHDSESLSKSPLTLLDGLYSLTLEDED